MTTVSAGARVIATATSVSERLPGSAGGWLVAAALVHLDRGDYAGAIAPGIADV